MKNFITLMAVAGFVLALAPTAQAADVTWSANVDTDWDESTLNWNAGAASFSEFDTAIFDGVVSGTVNLTADRTPEVADDGVTVSGANDYEFTGAGITGDTGLTKSGTGTLTLSNTGNTYSRGTFINTAVAGGNIVATAADSLGTGNVFLYDTSDWNQPGLVLSLSNDSGTTWANNFQMLNGKNFDINVGGGGAAGTTHTFGDMTYGNDFRPGFTGSDGYNLNVGAISSGHILTITSNMDGELTIASVSNPGSTRSMSFFGGSTHDGLEVITVTGDVLRTAPNTYNLCNIGSTQFDREVDLTVGGIFQVRNSRITDSTFTSTGTMLFEIIDDGNHGSEPGQGSAEILGLGSADTLNVDGKFDFDLTEATESLSTIWQVVGANIDVTYGGGFSVDGWTDAGSGVWKNPTPGTLGSWQFSESTGQLTMVPAATPAPITTVTTSGLITLDSFTVGTVTYNTTGLVTGTSVKTDGHPLAGRVIGNQDNFDLNLIFSRGANPADFRWNTSLFGGENWYDTNGDGADFFIFEARGNDTLKVAPIFTDDTVGQYVEIVAGGGTNWGDTGVTVTGPIRTGDTIFGVGFAITDLKDAGGLALTNSTVIKGLAFDAPGIDIASISAVPAPSITATGSFDLIRTHPRATFDDPNPGDWKLTYFDGSIGAGTLNVAGGSLFDANGWPLSVGWGGGTSTVTVTGAGSEIRSSNGFSVGVNTSPGALIVEAGGLVDVNGANGQLIGQTGAGTVLVTGANSKLTIINGQLLIGQQATAGNGSTLTIADSGLVQTKTLKFGLDSNSGGYVHMGVGGVLAVSGDKTGGTPFASGGLFTTGGDGGEMRYNPSGDGTTWVNMTGATGGTDYSLVYHSSSFIVNGQELNGYTVLMMPSPALAATLTATTDIDGGTAIPTTAGSYDDSTANTAPYVYNIDNIPGDTAQNTLIDFNMSAFDLTYDPAHTTGLGVTINASSLLHGTGGNFDFQGDTDNDNGGPDLTIVVGGMLAARSVTTKGANPADNYNAGSVTLIGPSGITLIDGIDTSATNNSGSANAGDIVLTSSAGSIQIGGDLVASARKGTSGAITLTAATGINLDGGINNGSYNGTASYVGTPGDITLDGGTGPVSIAGLLDSSSSSKPEGILTITTSGDITVDQLDLSLVRNVSLNGSSVSSSVTIGMLHATADITDFISGTDFTGFYDVSSDVFYGAEFSDPLLDGATYNIIENGVDNGFELKPAPNTAPTGADKTVTVNEDTAHTFSAKDFGFSDADFGATLKAVRIDTQTLTGGSTLKLGTVDVTDGQVIAAANFATLVYTENGNGLDSFTFSVQDSADAFADASNTITINVDNDALTNATLTATTDIDGGTAIPTTAGSYHDSTANTAPYVYNIDNIRGDTAQNTLIDFNMSAFDLNYDPAHTTGLGVTINASSLSHGTGGTFDFSGVSHLTGGVDLSIVVDGMLAARSVDTSGANPTIVPPATVGDLDAGSVTLIGPSGITLIDGIDTSATNSGGLGGDIVLTSSPGSIQIGGDLVASARTGTSGAITLTAATGINLDGDLSNWSSDGRGQVSDITLNGGTGPVTIDGLITSDRDGIGTEGDLTIETSGVITLGQLDLSLLSDVSLLGSSVTIGTLHASDYTTGARYSGTPVPADITDFISGTDFTGFYDVSSDVIYDPDNSDPLLGGLTYTIIEGNGDVGGFELKPPPYAVTYDGNGHNAGTPPADQIKVYGVALTLASDIGTLEKTGYTFTGWNTAADGTGIDYALGASYTVNAVLPLFAKWVTGVDDPPVVANGLPDVTADEDDVDDTIDLSNVFNDPDDANSSITKTAVSSDTSLVVVSVSGDTLTLDYQADQNGTATITVTGTSNTVDVNDTFTVTVAAVDAPPVVANALPDVTATEDDADLTIDLSNVFNDVDDDNASITKTAVSSAESLVTAMVDANGSTLTLNFQADANGTATITVTGASNGQDVNDSFVVTVNGVDDPPVVANALADVNATEDDADLTIALSNVFNDVDDDNASISKTAVSNNSSVVSVTVSGDELTLEYGSDANGTATITVTGVSNAQPVEDEFTVTVTATDDPPVVANPIDDVAATEGDDDDTIELANVFNDVDDDNASITKTATSSDESLVTATVSGDTLTLDYQADANGTTTITVTGASNGQDVNDSFVVVITGVDDPPVVTNAIADLNVLEDAADTTIDLSSLFNDVDDDNASITKTAVSSDPSLVTATANGNTLTLDFQAEQNGTATVTVTGTSNGQAADDTFTVAITNVDDPPVVANAISNINVNEDAPDKTIDLSNMFNDVDDDNASITKSAVSSEVSLVVASVIGNTLTLNFQPNQFGTATITLTGTSNGQTVDDNVTVTVTSVDDPPVVANAIADMNVLEDAADTTIDLSDVFNDIDDDNASITKTAVSSDSSLVTATVNGNILTLDYQAEQNGTATVTVTGTSNGQTVDDNVTVAVTSVDDPPVVANAIADVNVLEDAADTTIDLSDVFNDVDDDNASITKTAVSSDPSLVTATVNGNILTLDYQAEQNGTATVTVTGTSDGQTVNDNVTVTVTSVDDPPVVANTITDVNVLEDAADTTIDLSNLFNDVDDDNASITKTAISSDPSLVTATVNGNILTLDYQAEQNGTATVTVTGASNGQTVNDIITVVVTGVDDPPVVINEIADILVQENPPTTTIDLSNVFNDVDDDNASIAMTAVSNDPSLVTATVSGKTLTLNYPVNRIGTAIVTVSATSNGQTAHDNIVVTVTNDRLLYVNASPGGSANGSGAFESNAVAAITATPDVGYEFTGWTGTGIAQPNSMSTTVSMTENRNVTATFKAITYPLSVTAGFGGTVTGSGIYAHGTDVNVTANPILSHHFTGWSGHGITDANASVTTVTMTEPRNITANFALNRYLLAVAAETGGYVIGSGTFGHGTIATIAAGPKTGYDFSGWLGQGTFDATSPYTLVYMTKDHNVTAKFQLKTYPLTVISGPGGTASGSGIFDHGTAANIIATPGFGQHFTGWSGISTSNAIDANTTVSMTNDRNVTANFAANRYNLNLLSESGGTAIGSGIFDHGTQATITAEPQTGYAFTGWTGEVTDLNASTTTVDMTQDRNVSVNFTINQHSLTISSGNGGSATGSGIYDYNSNVTITAIPDTGYDFGGWTGTGVNNPDSPITTVSLSQDRNLTATFVLQNHILSVTAGFGGSATGSGSFPYGTDANVTATPATGHDFSGWIGPDVTNANSPETTVSITQDRNISATFTPQIFALQVTSSVGGSAYGGGNYSYGTNIVITAIPNTSYYFTGWDGNGVIDSNSPSSSVSIVEDINVTANFALIPANQHVLQTFVDPVGSGSTTGGGTFSNGTIANVTAIPKDGHVFSKWSGSGITDINSSETTVTVTADLNVTARFEIGFYLLAVTSGQGGSVIGGGNFAHGETPSISASPDTGYSFVKWVGEGVANSTSASTTVHMNNNRNVSAEFAPTEHVLTVSASAGGSVMGGGQYLYGTNAEITATANEGYVFSGWNGSGISDLNTSETTVFMNADRNATANFELNTYILAIEAEPSNGGTVIGGGTYSYGQNVNIAASPNIGYNFVKWEGDGPTDSNSSSTTIDMKKNRSVSAIFAMKDHVLTLTSSSGGSVTGEGNYSYGTDVEITATASEGYAFSGWEGAGITDRNVSTTTVSMKADRNVTASFELTDLILVIASEPSDGGSVLGSGNYIEGQTVHIAASPNAGYRFLGWIGGNPADSNANYTTVNVSVSETMTARFEKIRYDVTVNSTPIGTGSVSGMGFFEHGDTVTLIATPIKGYELSHWSGSDLVSVATREQTLTVTNNLNLVATFERHPEAGTLSYALDAEYIDHSWHYSPWFGYFHKTTDHWNYHLDFGWIFAQPENDSSLWFWTQHLGWLWTNKDIYPYVWRQNTYNWNYFSRTANNSFSYYDYSSSSWQKFSDSYEVKVVPFPSEGGLARGSGIYKEGTVIEIQATPNESYRFKRWFGDATGTDPSTTVVTGRELIIYAQFEKITP